MYIIMWPDLRKSNILNNVPFWVSAHASLPLSILAIQMAGLQSSVTHWWYNCRCWIHINFSKLVIQTLQMLNISKSQFWWNMQNVGFSQIRSHIEAATCIKINFLCRKIWCCDVLIHVCSHRSSYFLLFFYIFFLCNVVVVFSISVMNENITCPHGSDMQNIRRDKV